MNLLPFEGVALGSVRQALYAAAKRDGLPVKVVGRGDRLFLVRLGAE